MHNFIVDFREEHSMPAAINAVDKDIFDEDCRRFLATQSGVGAFGVNGGEEDIRREADGTPAHGGRPFNNELQSTKEGRSIRDRLRDYVRVEDGVRPPTNWYRDHNRVFENYFFLKLCSLISKFYSNK